MAYTIELTNNQILTVVEDGTIDNTTDLKLVGKNYSGYGEIQNENFVKLLENFASEQQPARPIPGQLWFDQDGNSLKLKVFDGNANKIFTPLAKLHQGELPTGTDLSAQNVRDGDLWWDDTTNQLYVYNGTEFKLVGPKVTTNRQTEVIEALVYDNQLPDPVDPGQIGNYQHLILKGIVDGKTLFVVSNDDFTLDSSNSIAGFDRLRKGINLVDTQEAEGGVTSSEYIINGSVTNAEKLGGVLAQEYIQRVGAEFLGQVDIKVNDGLAVGATGQLVLEYVGGAPTIKASVNDEYINFITNDSNGLDKVSFQVRTQGPTPGEDLTYNLGSTARRWADVHAANFRGVADKADTLLDESGNYRSLDKVENANTVVRRDSAGDIFARELHADALRNKEDSNAAITALVTKAETILVNGADYRTGSTAADVDTVAVRDESGNLTANVFNGVATRSSTIAVGSQYFGANINSSPNTVAVRDANEAILSNEFIGELTGNAASASKWQTPRTLSFQGDISGSGTWDGSSDLTINITNNADSIALGTDTTGNFVESIAEVNGEPYLNVFINGVQDGSGRENAVVTLGLSASATAQQGVLAARDGSGDLYANTFHGAFSGDISGNLTGDVTGNLTGNVTGNLTGNVTGNLTGNADGDHTGTFTGDHAGDVYDYIGQGASKVVDVTAKEFKGFADDAKQSDKLKTISTSDAGNFYLDFVPNDAALGEYQAHYTNPSIYVEPDSATLHANIFDGISATFGTINVTTLNYVGESGGIIPLKVGGLGVDASDASGKATARSNLDILSTSEVDNKIDIAIQAVNQTIGGISTSEIKNINDPAAPQKVTTTSTNITMTHNSTGHSTYDADGITLHTGNFIGVATQAYYADLAEKYLADADYPVGTVMMVGGEKEITACNETGFAAGVVSENPAYLMNADLENGTAIAFVGRVPVRILGAVRKGDKVFVDVNGCASTKYNGNSLVGIALASNLANEEKLVECMLKL
jgi:hypothetical protein